MKDVVFDTETTGLNPNGGDRIVEIGAIELNDLIPTGREYHAYINPEREVGADAVRIHGLSTEFLKDKPTFSEIAKTFQDFVGDSSLVAHNASFDAGFLNMELERCGLLPYNSKRYYDTLILARKIFPRATNSLDALCRRYGIDTSHRELHGALKDAKLLAEVYLELCGGRQRSLEIGDSTNSGKQKRSTTHNTDRQDHTGLELTESRMQNAPRTPFVLKATQDERKAHAEAISKLSAPIWESIRFPKAD